MRVSLVTATYNSGLTIGRTLTSVTAQIHSDIEHIIIDGKSTDNTLDVISQFPHVSKVISEPDKGIYDAINKGISSAKGDVIGILNSDDYYPSETIVSDIVNEFQKDDTVEVVYADLDYVDESDPNVIYRKWRTGSFKKIRFLFGWTIPHPTLFVKKEVYKKYGLYNTDFHLAGDYEYILRILYKHNVKPAYLKKVAVKMQRGGAGNGSLTKRNIAHKEDHVAWKTNGLNPYFFTVTLKPFRKITQYIGPQISRLMHFQKKRK